MIYETDYNRVIVIGDIHGYLSPLIKMIKIIDINDKDLVVFIGDYIDRGPESKDVVQKLIELKFLYKNIIFLKGNHEDMLLGSIGYDAVIKEFNTWIYNGGTKTLLSYGLGIMDVEKMIYSWSNRERSEMIMDVLPKSHIDFLRSLNSCIETDSYFICHAGVNPYASIEEGKKNTFDLLWMRDHLLVNDLRWEKTVVCGHTPLEDVRITEKLICVDTGLFYFGKLSAIDLLTKKIFQVTM